MKKNYSLSKKNLKNIAKLAKQKNDKTLIKLLSDLSNVSKSVDEGITHFARLWKEEKVAAQGSILSTKMSVSPLATSGPLSKSAVARK